MLKNFTIYVEKKEKFAVEAKQLQSDFNEFLGLKSISKVRVFNCYIVQSITVTSKNKASWIVFGEKPLDMIYENKLPPLKNYYAFGVTYLPGQYDQRADSAAQCLHILEPERIYNVKYIKIIAVMANTLSETDILKIKKYCINPIDSIEYQLDNLYSNSELFTMNEAETNQKNENLSPKSLISENSENTLSSKIQLIGITNDNLMEIKKNYGLAMDLDDLIVCRDYFSNIEKRNPTETEIKVIDTYWSDHCRHKTFNTFLDDIKIKKNDDMPFIKKTIEHAFEQYLSMRKEVHGANSSKPITLMDIATINAKYAKKREWLTDLEESEEVNAASIYANGVNGLIKEPWIIQFKNETHNHPTEIEPFGGAATCLGGAIRDPLSGRSIVYHAMRITGSADPRESIEKTLNGKLPQRKITTRASDGFSSYGNQIGLATGYVKEYYHPGFKAKRMELGVVIGAVLKTNVFRDTPIKGDVIILLGGKTGRDGCGGATGSSKEHTEASIHNASAEVQKGNAPEERKLMRLFRNSNVTKLIKKCNDFGAGGVCVAIGELAKGIHVILDDIPKKYAGLNATELAISESQERMAVMVASKNVKKFIDYAHNENCEATVVAYVTNTNRLVMSYKGVDVVSIDRAFFDTNGAIKHAKVLVESPIKDYLDNGIDQNVNTYSSLNGNINTKFNTHTDANIHTKEKLSNKKVVEFKDAMIQMVSSLQYASQQGLTEKFDSTVGAYSVLMPFGGKYQLTRTEGMVAVLPYEKGNSSTVTIMTSGYDPYLSTWSPFHGGIYSIVEVLSKITALGGNIEKAYLTLQEYFPATRNNEKLWGNVFQALLGAFYAQHNFKVSAIGGKDSMSGTYNELEVPPVVAAFGVCVGNVNTIISHEFKYTNSVVIATDCKIAKDGLPDFNGLIDTWRGVYKAIADKKIFSAYAVKSGGIAEAFFQMSIGNKIGMEIEPAFDTDIFKSGYGVIIAEVNSFSLNDLPFHFDIVGKTIKKPLFKYKNEEIGIDYLLEFYQKPLENVFPTTCDTSDILLPRKYLDLLGNSKSIGNESKSNSNHIHHANYRKLQPKVVITVFPGTNCEFETVRAFEKAGADAEVIVCKNLSIKDIYNSLEVFAKTIRKSQILMIPGGFSAGDEPEGAGKFIASFFRNSYMTDAVRYLLEKDGLILGICNGFQALIKLGLLPYGDVCEIQENSPILTCNKIGRHVSRFVNTKIITNSSPWLAGVSIGDIHTLPLSHGEGRFVASQEVLIKLAENSNIAAVYVDHNGNLTKEMPHNPNGSDGAIEALISRNGRILGKMAHSERFGPDTYKNITGNFDQKLFKSGVDYFK